MNFTLQKQNKTDSIHVPNTFKAKISIKKNKIPKN